MQDQFSLCFMIKRPVNGKDTHYYWNDATRSGSIFAKSYAKIDSGSRGQVPLTLCHLKNEIIDKLSTFYDFHVPLMIFILFSCIFKMVFITLHHKFKIVI